MVIGHTHHAIVEGVALITYINNRFEPGIPPPHTHTHYFRGAAPKNWGLSQSPGAGGEPLGAGGSPRGLAARPSPWRVEAARTAGGWWQNQTRGDGFWNN